MVCSICIMDIKIIIIVTIKFYIPLVFKSGTTTYLDHNGIHNLLLHELHMFHYFDKDGEHMAKLAFYNHSWVTMAICSYNHVSRLLSHYNRFRHLHSKLHLHIRKFPQHYGLHSSPGGHNDGQCS